MHVRVSMARYLGNVAYQVCSALPDGTLIVPDSFIDRWSRTEFGDRIHELVKNHNEKYNKSNKKLETAAASDLKEKKFKDFEGMTDNDIHTVEDWVKKFPEGERLTIPGGELLVNTNDPDTGKLWVAAKDKDITTNTTTEVFSFGSGSFLGGPEADTLAQDPNDAWLAFHVDTNTPVMFETDPKASDINDRPNT